MKIRITLLLLPILAVLISSVTAFSASASEEDYTQYFLDPSGIEDFDVYYSSSHIKELIHERYPEENHDHYFMSVTSSSASGSSHWIHFYYFDDSSVYSDNDIYSIYYSPFAVDFIYGSAHTIGGSGLYPKGSYLVYDKQTGQSFTVTTNVDTYINAESPIDRDTGYIYYQTSSIPHFPITEGVNTYCSKVFSSSFFSNVMSVYNFAFSLIITNSIALLFIGVPILISGVFLFYRLYNRRLS